MNHNVIVRSALSLTGGNAHDVTQLLALVDAIPAVRGRRGRPRHRPEALLADRGYDFDRYRRELRQRGIRPAIARRGVLHGSRVGRHRWVVERVRHEAP
jgi:IS5 family transposase